MSSNSNPKAEALKQSGTKMQTFFGCDYMDEKYNPSNNNRQSTMTQFSDYLKTIFTMNKNTKQNRIVNRRKSTPNMKRMLWRPSLQVIYKDSLLLNALINFMQVSYNSENILFLLAVRKLQQTTKNTKNTKNTNYVISSIYNTYIIPNAPYQINVSYECIMNILSKRDKFASFDIKTKHSMFDQCVHEIQALVITSILPSFYRSSSFQIIAKQSKYYKSNYIKRPCLSYSLSDSTTDLSTDVNSEDFLTI